MHKKDPPSYVIRSGNELKVIFDYLGISFKLWDLIMYGNNKKIIQTISDVNEFNPNNNDGF